MDSFLFFVVPVSSIILLFVKDANKKRRRIMAVLLITNTLFFLFPLIYAYIKAYPDDNMWNENGVGAILWSYIVILPASFLIQFVLFVLKVLYASSRKHLYEDY
ncbi:MAG: hypothetical protein KDD04_05240 [Sinomicrobium sp.]|nr:hypothetical protein [Sinomicrobium sp.]